MLSSIRFVWICTWILAPVLVSLSSYGKQRTSRFLSAQRIQASYGIVMISPVEARQPNDNLFTDQPDLDSVIFDPFIEASEVVCVYSFTKGFGNDGRLVPNLYTVAQSII